jgi:hypothetical protein
MRQHKSAHVSIRQHASAYALLWKKKRQEVLHASAAAAAAAELFSSPSRNKLSDLPSSRFLLLLLVYEASSYFGMRP